MKWMTEAGERNKRWEEEKHCESCGTMRAKDARPFDGMAATESGSGARRQTDR